MRLAKGTPGFIVGLWVAPMIVKRTSARVFLAALAAGCTWFFRDPRRTAAGDGLVAAADGVVQWVHTDDQDRETVSTYLNLLDVHVTRAPCAGTVVEQSHRRGLHRAAFSADAHQNERLEWVLATEYGTVRLTQFAGTMARRIVAHKSPGEVLRRGERIGLIRFGSRVDVQLPVGLRAAVSAGQRVRGGETVLARIASS